MSNDVEKAIAKLKEGLEALNFGVEIGDLLDVVKDLEAAVESSRMDLEASRWNANDLCEQRNRLRTFVIEHHGIDAFMEAVIPNVQDIPKHGVQP